MQTSAPDTHNDLRDALRALCAQFPPEYHRRETYPGHGLCQADSVRARDFSLRN